MPLELVRARVDRLVPGERTHLRQHVLTVDASALTDELRANDERIRRVHVDMLAPGDEARVLCVKDVVEPRTRLDATEGDDATARVLSLSGAAVVTCGPIVGFQEGIIDMNGTGAAYTPFSALHLLVLRIEVIEGLEPHAHEETLRHAGLRAAAFLADACTDAVPDDLERYDRAEPRRDLPSLGYIAMVLAQGLLHDTYVEGRNAREGLPRLIGPERIFDNAIISGNCVSACDKNTTWHHQNNPVIRELFKGHGQRWNFAGVVLTNELTRLEQKEASAERAIELARQLNVDGVVISKEGFGNPDADLMMLIRGLETRGIRTVAITDEYAGNDGASPSLADATPEADAIVSTGNANARVSLPAMTRVLGPVNDVERLAGAGAGRLHDDGSLDVELQVIMGATNEMGHQALRAVEH